MSLNSDEIESMEINPIPNEENDDTFKIELVVTKKNKGKNYYISKDTELDFFKKANTLLYTLEYRNIQDIMKKSGMNNDIYHLFTYLWNKNKTGKYIFGNYFEKKTIADGTQQKIVRGKKLLEKTKKEHQIAIINFIQDTNNFTPIPELSPSAR